MATCRVTPEADRPTGSAASTKFDAVRMTGSGEPSQHVCEQDAIDNGGVLAEGELHGGRHDCPSKHMILVAGFG
jgi:hypothetical protein